MRHGHARTVSALACRVRRNLEKLPAFVLIVSAIPILSVLSGCAGFANGANNQTSTGSFELSPSNLNFGQVVIGKQATQAVTISNTGKVVVKINQITFSNDHFSAAPMFTPMLLPVGRTESFNVTVNPTTSGNLMGTLAVQADGTPAAVISLSATALSSQAQMSVNPGSINFGTVSTGSKGITNLSITNLGAADLTVSMLALTGADFTLSGITTPKTIASGQTAPIALTFSPTAAGGVTGSLSVTSNDPTHPTITIPMSGTGTATATGQLSANLANLSFGSVSRGASASKQFVLANTGNAPVTISSIQGFGLTVSEVTTPTTLNPSQNLTISTSFSPSSVGSVTGSITIVSNAPNSPLTIPFTGTGVQAELSVSPANYNFGSVLAGQTKSQTITLSNTGTTALTIAQLNTNGSGFSVSGIATPLTIPAGGNATFHVLFAPTASGNLTGAVSIASNASTSPSVLSLAGTGTAASFALSANPASLSFSNMNAGSSGSKTLTISNNGNTGLTISRITTSGQGFSVSGMTTPLTLAAGQNATINVTFKPAGSGTVTGSILISSTQGANAMIPVSGNAVQPVLSSVPATIGFGNVTEGSTASQTVQLANSGTGILSITQITVTGTGYSAGTLSLPLSLNSGQSANVNIQFDPSFAGLASGSVVVVSNASNSPSLVSLTGTGVAATQTLALSATSLAFGKVNAGSSSTQTITLTNAGNSSVTVSQITESGTGFTLSGVSTPVKLTAGQSTTFGVTFNPSTSGSSSGSVTVASTAAGYPKGIALSGTGVQPVAYAVGLNWNPSTSSVVGYNVYRSTLNGSGYNRLNSGLLAGLNYNDATVQSGMTYYYVVTAVDTNGEESVNSNQATAVIP